MEARCHGANRYRSRSWAIVAKCPRVPGGSIRCTADDGVLRVCSDSDRGDEGPIRARFGGGGGAEEGVAIP